MLISIINFTSKPDQEVQDVLRAINRQIAEDFGPNWHIDAGLRLEGRVAPTPSVMNERPPELRGDAVIYLWDVFDSQLPFGFHDLNFAGIPFGFVFTEISDALNEPWSVTLSHEALELIADAEVNRLAAGPHPDDADKLVFHWYEMCDAVQTETYTIDEIAVSNFVLPLYFTLDDELGSRNDFLGTGVPSFGVNPGGYVGFYDPELGDHDQWFHPHAGLAKKRNDIKVRALGGRRSLRYQQQVPEGLWNVREVAELCTKSIKPKRAPGATKKGSTKTKTPANRQKRR